MIIVKEHADGELERLHGNPTLTSLDGETRAPLKTIMAPSWTNADRAKFGVYVVDPVQAPEGKQLVGEPTYEKRKGAVVQVRSIEDIPAPVVAEPEPDNRTPQEKMADLAAALGLTLDDMRDVLIGGRA